MPSQRGPGARVKRAHIGFQSKQKREIARWTRKAWQVGHAQQWLLRAAAGEAVVTAEGGRQDSQKLGLQLARALSGVSRLHDRATAVLAGSAIPFTRNHRLLPAWPAGVVTRAGWAGLSPFGSRMLRRVVCAAGG